MLQARSVSPLSPVAGDFPSDPEETWNPNAEMALRETTIAQADIDTDARVIAERVYDRMAERIPGWVAHDSELATILIDEFSTVAAEIRQEALSVPEAIFVTYGEEVLGIPIAPPEPATGWADWTAIDDRGYTVGPSTQFTLARSGDELVVFEVVAGATIPPGQRVASHVQVRSLESGANGNGLSGPGDPVDPLVWVESIDVSVPTWGGSNGQTNDEYISDLISLLRVIALRPILPWDFAILALRVYGVGRAIAMDGYRPSDGTWGHAREITLVLTDDDGEPCHPEVKANVREMLEALRELNWRVWTVDAEYVTIDVAYTVTAFAEQNPELVRELCDLAIRDALSPANFRLGTTSPSIAAGEVIPPPESGQQPGRQTLRVNDFVGLLDRTRGVDWVEHDGVLINGNHDDYQMPGPTTLPRPGAITGTVNTQ
jgi:hypothetical protein